MTSKEFCDDKILRAFICLDLIGSVLTAHGYSPTGLAAIMRVVGLITFIAFILFIKSEIRTKGQIITVCVGLFLNYGLQAIGISLYTSKKSWLLLRFVLFAVIMLFQAMIYLFYISDANFPRKVQQFIFSKKFWIFSLLLFIMYFFIFGVYIITSMMQYEREIGNLMQEWRGFIYIWIQDIVSKGIVCYAYFRSITWYKHVGKGASSEK